MRLSGAEMCRQRRYVATPDSSSSPNVGRVFAQTAAWNLSVTLWQNQLLSLYLFAIFDGDMRSVCVANPPRSDALPVRWRAVSS